MSSDRAVRSFRNLGNERDSENGSESDTDDGFNESATRAVLNATSKEQVARELFALDQIKNTPIPKLKKSGTAILPGLLKTKSHVEEKIYKARTSFDEEDAASENADSARLNKKLRPRVSKKATHSPDPERRSSYAWAETASRMRRSIRLKKGLHKDMLSYLEEERDGKVIVRNKREKKVQKQHTLYNKELRNNLKGVAALLTGEHLMNAKLMGTKSFWKLSDLISTPSLLISKYIMIKTAREIIGSIYNMHLRLNAHGQLSSGAVLLDRSLNVALMKAKTVNVKGKFNLKRLQNDILQAGVVVLELFCRKRVGIDFCPLASKAQALEFTLGERNVHMYRSTRRFKVRKEANKKKKAETFGDIEANLKKEVQTALDDAKELEGLDTLKGLIIDCFSANPDERPFSQTIVEVLKQTEDGYTTSQEIDKEQEQLEFLKSIMNNNKIGNAFVRGPRLVDFAKGKTEQEQKDEIEKIQAESLFSPKAPRVDGITSSAAPGYVTDDSRFIEDVSDSETVTTEVEQLDLEEIAANNEALDIKQRLKAKGVSAKQETKKKKKAFNPLRAFLKQSRNMSVEEEKEIKLSDETKSNVETSARKKPKGKKKKKIDLSQFSKVGDESETFEYETQSLQEDNLTQQRSIHVEVKNNYGVNQEDLKVFKAGFEKVAKKRAKKRRNLFDPEKVAQKFQVQKRLSIDQCEDILNQAEAILKDEPNLLRLEAPVTVVGDIHGQFFDLRKMMEECGTPGAEIGKTKDKTEHQSYLFLGDYVDRGKFSCEVLFYLLVLKIRHNSHVWLLRGNHESKATSGYFGFKEECEKKYGPKIFLRCCEIFQAMPVAAVINTPGGSFFCLHGGISNHVRNLNQFVELDRFKEPEMFGFLCDVLWADPISIEDDEEELDSDDEELEEDDALAEERRQNQLQKVLGEYYSNPLRGCSVRFGLGALMTFLKNNNLVGIIRAHQVQQEGYSYHFQELAFDHFVKDISALSNARSLPSGPDEVCPPIITVFSAPNYCGRYGNKGAYLNVFCRPQGLDSSSQSEEDAVAPLGLLDPVQFEAAYEPAVVHFPNEREKHHVTLKETCPYMPLGYEELFQKAMSLQKVDFVKVLSDNAHEVWQNAVKNNEIPVEESNVQEKPPLPPRKKNSNDARSTTVRSLASSAPSVDTSAVNSWQSFRARMNNYEKAAKKKYQKAKQDDMINEIHPELIQKKTKQATEIIGNPHQGDFNLPSQILLEDDVDKRRQTASIHLSKLQEEKAVKFAKRELIALQTLFLLIDASQSGSITARALIDWTENSGGFLLEEDAQHTVEILDFDKDGVIGFEDFLVFAAACKKMWTAEQLAKILTKGYSQNA